MKQVLITALTSWFAHDPFRKSASAAYCAIFSIPGLLIIVTAVASLFFDRQTVDAEVLARIRRLLGSEAATSVRSLVDHAQVRERDVWAVVIGIPTLIFGATGLFVELQNSLNQIWEVEVKKSAGVWPFIKTRIISLGVILAIGFVLLVSMVVTTVLTLLTAWFSARFPGLLVAGAMGVNLLLSILTTGAFFTLIFRILPDAEVLWRHALRGGLLSAFLFMVGQYGMTVYFTTVSPQSAFGAAGAIVLLMLWVSYSCLILFMGAEFTKAYAEWDTSRKAKPTEIARKTPESN